ncbi:MAG: cupin domain-containing protein [Bdellovibrionota bacterium]
MRQAQKIEKPWGYELVWAKTDCYAGKILHIKKGESLSLQYHQKKEETQYVLSGRIRLEVEENGKLTPRELGPGEGYHFVPGTKHRLTAIEDADVLEASTAELDDVVRLEDRYGRAKGC